MILAVGTISFFLTDTKCETAKNAHSKKPSKLSKRFYLHNNLIGYVKPYHTYSIPLTRFSEKYQVPCTLLLGIIPSVPPTKSILCCQKENAQRLPNQERRTALSIINTHMQSYIRVRRPAHLINFLYFTSILIGVLAVLLYHETTHATKEYPYNAPPSHVSYCLGGFIGYEYSPTKERKCYRLWGMFTREILLEESDYFSHL